MKDFLGNLTSGIKKRLISKTWVIVLGVVSLILLAGGLLTLSTFINITSDPGYDMPEDAKVLRQTVLKEGKPEELRDDVIGYRVTDITLLSKPSSSADATYACMVSPDNRLSDYFSLWRDEFVGEYRFSFSIIFEYTLSTAKEQTLGFPFLGQAELAPKNAKPSESLAPDPHAAHWSFGFDESGNYQTRLEPDNLDSLPESARLAAKTFEERYKRFHADLGNMFVTYGLSSDWVSEGRLINERLFQTYEILGTTAIATVICLSLLVFTGTSWFVGFMHRLAKKRIKAATGVEVQSRADIQDIILEKEAERIPTLEELPDGLDTALARRVSKIKVKPFIHENVIRAIGLSLLFLTSVFAGVLAFSKKISPGSSWVAGLTAVNPFVLSVNALANLILILVIATIVGETRKNLLRTSLIFFTLGMVYYVVVSGIMFYVERVSANSIIVALFLLAFQIALPGNIFIALGLFSFVGFFLFTNPSRKVISRRVFRLLSLIPTGVAIGAIVYTLFMNVGKDMPSYWFANLLFLRDPTLYFLGIGWEFIIYGLRIRFRKKLNIKDGAEIEQIPELQMVKNIALCAFILFFTILFYIIPAGKRVDFGFPSDISLAFLAIPLFLFQKPSGAKRKAVWDIIYYAIFLICYLTPSMMEAFFNLLSHA